MSGCWKFGLAAVEAQLNAWHLLVDTRQPANGITIQRAGEPEWKLLCIEACPSHELQVLETYVRDKDLIVRFDQSASDSFAFQLNYRLLSPQLIGEVAHRSSFSDVVGVELWTSVQTNLLDAVPTLIASSSTPAASGWETFSYGDLGQIGDDVASDAQRIAAIVSRADNYTGVWLLDPNDERSVRETNVVNTTEQQVRLFGHFMEKGVIRRSRLRFYLVAGTLAVAELASLSDLPLALSR